jgi:hypothetical protein
MISKNEIESSLLLSIDQRIRELGFRKNNARQSLFRKTPYGKDCLHVALVSLGNDVSVIPDISLRFDDLEDLIFNNTTNYIPLEMRSKVSSIGSTMTSLIKVGRDYWTIRDLYEIEQNAESIVTAFKQYGLPYIEKYSDKEAVFWGLSFNSVEAELLCVVPLTRALAATGLAFLLGKTEAFHQLSETFENYLRPIRNSGIETFIEFITNLEHQNRN